MTTELPTEPSKNLSPTLEALARNPLNWTRYVPGQKQGHYESFYQRANHPTRPLAFWIRYTVFQPQGQPGSAIGELWAIFFNGETGEHVAVKEEYPISRCRFDRQGWFARVQDAVLKPGKLSGSCLSTNNRIGWNLSFDGEEPPLLHLPKRYYQGGFPKAKSLVGLPLALFRGTLEVNGRTIDIDDWIGSQNHNWGSKHTDYYAFGQVSGFDNSPRSFLEIASARLKIGPVWTPTLTPLVLRHAGRDHVANSLVSCWANKGEFGCFYWDFAAGTKDLRIEGKITAPASAFVGLNYYNPPGGIKHCLNTKIASCQLTLTDRATGAQEVLTSQHRAVFEILTDDRGHGVKIRA